MQRVTAREFDGQFAVGLWAETDRGLGRSAGTEEDSDGAVYCYLYHGCGDEAQLCSAIEDPADYNRPMAFDTREAAIVAAEEWLGCEVELPAAD